MRYSQSSCSGLFVCTAILCWDYQNLKYSFFNITKCTPKAISFKKTFHLIFRNNNYSKIEEKYLINGFICSNCTRENFLEENLNPLDHCYRQITRIKLIDYCQYLFQDKKTKTFCQCLPSDQPIQPIKYWIKALIKPGKSDTNTNRVNNINKSASSFIYILVSFILLIVFFGGIVAMIFYWIQFKSSQRRTFK